jgi:uncharacterized protein YggE
MKRAFITVAAFAAAVALPANAQEASPRQKCALLSGYAEVAMLARQNGTDITVLFDRLTAAASDSPDPELSERLSKVFEAYLIEAYEQPHFSTEEMQQRTIADFKNAKHVECLRTFADRE